MYDVKELDKRRTDCLYNATTESEFYAVFY